MDNYQGDLTDILRASGSGTLASDDQVVNWQFASSDLMNVSSSMEELPRDNFGNPFSNMRDPLLQELDVLAAGSSFFNNQNASSQIINTRADHDTAVNFGGSSTVLAQPRTVLEGGQMKNTNICGNNNSSSSMFSRMMISPNQTLPSVPPPCDGTAMASPRGIKTSAMVPSDVINANSSNGNSCLVESSSTTGLQISSPRNTGIKRRKSQAKKVVCIPAPAAANRPGGEVVPSDLWAWRKYGQKPIKGSPYPRGYYRCSSSKGCSARKQVERSRTDPNMLVITYTSEHNHPWPTQRNALAGSTRSQTSRSTNATSKGSPSSQTPKTTVMKEEQKDSNSDNVSPSVAAGSSTTCASVKEEAAEDIDKQLDMDDADCVEEFSNNFNNSEDFFADLGELEIDPLNLMFNQGLTGEEQKESNKSMDPFNIFDWSAGKQNNNNNGSFGGEN